MESNPGVVGDAGPNLTLNLKQAEGKQISSGKLSGVMTGG